MQWACAILYSVACLNLPIFPHYLINGTIFEKKRDIENEIVLIFSTTFVGIISHSKKNWARNYHKLYRSYVKYPLFLLDFNETWIFSTGFFKNTQILNLMKIRSVRAEFHAPGWTDMTKLTVAFRNFTDAPKNYCYCSKTLLLDLYTFLYCCTIFYPF